MHALPTQIAEDNSRRVVVILLQAVLDLIETKRDTVELLDAFRDSGEDGAEDARPDILHQCLLTLQESPLNRSGNLSVLIHTSSNDLIEVSPQCTIPISYDDFTKVMIHLLNKKKVRANEKNVALLKMVKNNLEGMFRSDVPKIGLSRRGREVDLPGYCADYKSHDAPIVFYVGAVAHADPATKDGRREITDVVSIANHELTASDCCAKICIEFERLWEI